MADQLHAAAEAGNAAALAAALAAGADPNAADEDACRPLHSACEHLACVEVVLAAGADPNATDDWGCTPIRGGSACAAALLAAGADPTAIIDDSETALHDAARYGQPAVVRLLLEVALHTGLIKNSVGAIPLLRALQNRSFD